MRLAGVAVETWWEDIAAPTPLAHHLAKHVADADAAAGWVRLPLGEHNPYQMPAHLGELASRRRVWVTPRTVSSPADRWRGVIDDEWPISSGQMARAYLGGLLADHARGRGGHGPDRAGRRAVVERRVPWRRADLEAAEISQPLWFDPEPSTGWGCYVDIVSCYPSLYLPVGLNPVFRPDQRRLGVGAIGFDRAGEVVADRELRNSVWGSTLAPRVGFFDRARWMADAAPNRFFSPGLRAYVWWTLHAVAQEARQRWRIPQWVTDAAICHPSDAAELVAWLWDRWRLRGRVKATGEYVRWNVYDWRIGALGTERALRGEAPWGQPVEGIRPIPAVTRDWLAETRQQLAPA